MSFLTIRVATRDYLTSLACDVAQFAKAVREHWGVENALHWVLDVSFREDDCRIRKEKGAQNFAVLRHIALNLLQRESSHKRGVIFKFTCRVFKIICRATMISPLQSRKSST